VVFTSTIRLRFDGRSTAYHTSQGHQGHSDVIPQWPLTAIGHRPKKRSEEMRTLRASCSKVEPKKIRPAADPLPGGAGRPKFNQLEMVTTFTNKPSLVRINARNFELSW